MPPSLTQTGSVHHKSIATQLPPHSLHISQSLTSPCPVAQAACNSHITHFLHLRRELPTYVASCLHCLSPECECRALSNSPVGHPPTRLSLRELGMATAAACACVSTNCCSLTNAREGYGWHPQQQQQQQASATSLTPRSAFCGQKLAASLKAQKWLPQVAPTQRRRVAKGARLQVSSVLAELDQTIVDSEDINQVDPRTVLSIILGGGAGTRLFPLTKRRAKPAVPIGGAYRLIDVPMSNCINSGIKKVFILTQFNSTSLNRHLARTYNFGNINFGDGFVEVLAATQTPTGTDWFQGTADAVRQYLWLFEDAKNKVVEDVVILSGDHLYRMDYMDFVQKHRDSGADITVSCVPMDDSRASDYGLMKIDDKGRVLYFNEKPKGADLKSMQVDTTILGLSSEEAAEKPYIASMGIYVFKKDILLKLLRWRYPTANDFGSEIIPASAKEFDVQAYLFNDYWEDIGTIKSFFDANLALTSQPPQFSFYDAAKPIFTSPRYLPPTSIEKCQVKDSIVSHGCFLRECSVEHSIVGIRSRLESGSVLKDTMMMGADFYETGDEVAELLKNGKIPLGVGANSRISNCIIDKNARIGKNVIIANTDNVQEAARPELGFYINTGVVVLEKNGIIKDGTVI